MPIVGRMLFSKAKYYLLKLTDNKLSTMHSNRVHHVYYPEVKKIAKTKLLQF